MCAARSVGDVQPTERSVAVPQPGGQQELAFGGQLRRLRRGAGMSRESLAERAGLGVATLAALEGGQRRRPYPSTVVALADALGLLPADRTALLELAFGSPAQPETAGKPPLVDTLTVARVRLPVQPTPLIGRQVEVAAATALLDPACSAVRLLTLTGPGGVGKTRLALAVAAALVSAYRDGVVFVDLAPLRDQQLVPATLADALEVRESRGRTARELLLEYLHARQLLLVLDNFEHLLGAAPLLAELLDDCSQLGLLVTSRAALRLRSEQRFTVPPLAAPTERQPSDDGAALEATASSAAVRLFVERAQAVSPDFALDLANADAVAAICRRLDGMPLAIELAAARVRLLRPDALLRRLQHRLPLLTGGAPDLPERHQTIRQTLVWSHDLLGLPEQVLFRRLAVFAGGCTLEATEAVCADADLPAERVLDLLDSLVNSSLVQCTVSADGESRFGMLETIRDYALEWLAAVGEAAEVGRRHVSWCLALVQPVSPEPPDPEQIARLAPEHDNLRAALRTAVEQGGVEDGLWLAAALWMPWYLRGSYSEGRAWVTELLALPGAEGAALARAHAMAAAGHLTYCQGEYEMAERLLDEGRGLADDLGHALLGGVTLHLLGNVARWRGDLTRAQSSYEAGLAIFRQVGHRVWEALALVLLASVVCEQGNLSRAVACAEDGLVLFEDIGNRWGICAALYALAKVAVRQGDRTRARSLHEAGLALNRELGDPQGTAWCLVALADDVLSHGEVSAARRLFTESLTLAERVGDRLTLARSLEGLASLTATDWPAQAVRLAGAAAAIWANLGATAQPAELQRLNEWLTVTRGALGEPAFAAAWTAGGALGVPHAVAEALQLPAGLAALALHHP